MQLAERVLSEDQIQQFIHEGYVMVRGCFSREQARRALDVAWRRIGCDPDDPATWTQPRIGTSPMHEVSIKDFAPRAYWAACQLLGGEERLIPEPTWYDAFKWNFAYRADDWREPARDSRDDWHKDGGWFRHFLDSPEQGLLGISCWTDVLPRGGGTTIVPDSIGPVARLLLAHPEGLDPQQIDARELIRDCRRFIDLSAEVGDVALHHPFMIHSVSPNALRVPRAIQNPAFSLRAPLRFDDPERMSPMERAITTSLGVERLDFQASGPRRILGDHVGDHKRHDALREQCRRLKHDPAYATFLAETPWRQTTLVRQMMAELE